MSIEAHKILGDAIRPVFEDVESRTMMSASALEGHVLTIVGTSGDDQIDVAISDDGSQVWTTVNGETSDAMLGQSIYEIHIDAGGGDNNVHVDSRINANAYVTTGGGHDVVTTGRGNDVINTGGGNDVIDSGAGDDRVYAGTGNDKINGGSGNDYLDGGKGNDIISADGGTDRIFGRKGDDKIYCDADDAVDGAAGRNQISKSSSMEIRNDGFVAPKIVSLSVVDADTGHAVAGYESLTSDTTLEPTKLPARYTVIANAEDGVQSVYFQTADNSLFRRDNGKEFSLTPSATDGKYVAWQPTAGKTYALSVVANTADDLRGFAGEAFTIKLTLKPTATHPSTGTDTTGASTGGGSSGTSTGSTTTPGGTSTGGTNTGGSTTTGNPSSTGGNPTGGTVDANAPKINVVAVDDAALVGQVVVLDATATTVPGHQIEDAHFEWNFGDPTGKHNVLPGFVAAHNYEKAGTYTATLTVTAPGGHVSTYARTVTVASHAMRTIYVAADGDDQNDGQSQDQAVRTVARAAQLITNDTRVLLRRGDTFGITAGVVIDDDNVAIATYGVGASPVLRYEGARTSTRIIRVEKAATNVAVTGLTFDSIFDDDTTQTNMPMGVSVAGTLVTIKDNTFLNVGYAISMADKPTGVLVADNAAPSATGVRSYFCWVQGTQVTIVGNKVANVTREHCCRIGGGTKVTIAYNDFTNLDRTSVDPNDTQKSAINQQAGEYTYIAYNKTAGVISVGPLGANDGLTTKSARFEHGVVEGNVVTGQDIIVQHGADHVTIRDNVIHAAVGGTAIYVTGFNAEYNRGTSDIVIDHNLAINESTIGRFLEVGGAVDGITLTDNTFVAPNLQVGGYASTAIWDHESTLSSFTFIDGNVWPTLDDGKAAYQGKLAIVGDVNDPDAYLDASAWNALAKVGTDSVASVNPNAFVATATALLKAA